MSGRLSTRFGEVTARARTLPLWMCGTAVEVPTMNMPTSPAISAVIAWAEDPRYGTWVISTFATALNNSAARWGAVPTPIEAKLSAPGFCRARSMNSRKLRTGSFGSTIRTW